MSESHTFPIWERPYQNSYGPYRIFADMPHFKQKTAPEDSPRGLPQPQHLASADG